MLTGGFVPQVAAFVTVGNAEGQVSFTNRTINGRSMHTWYGMYIATPAWKDFMNTYLAAANIQPDNSYGNPDPRFTGGVQQPQPSQQSQQRSSGRQRQSYRHSQGGQQGNQGTGQDQSQTVDSPED